VPATGWMPVGEKFRTIAQGVSKQGLILPGKWTSRKQQKRKTETRKVLRMLTSALVYSGPDLWCCLSYCLLRVCFCSCSVWCAATSVPRSKSLNRWLVWFAHSFTRCLATKTVLPFLQIFFGRG